MDDRIALLGANGNGKSTLAKLLADRLAPLAGEIRRGPKLRVGYFAQHQTDELVESDNPIDHMTRALPRASPPQVRAQLARFGLDADRAETPVASLSGRREGAAAAVARHARGAAAADPGRAHQPPRHRRARGAGEGAGRLPGRGAADHPRSASGRADRRPAVAGRRRHGAAVRRRSGRLPRAARRARAPGDRSRTPAPAATSAANAPMPAPRWRRCASRRAMPRRGWRGWPRNGRRSRRRWPTRRSMSPRARPRWPPPTRAWPRSGSSPPRPKRNGWPPRRRWKRRPDALTNSCRISLAPARLRNEPAASYRGSPT